MLPCFHYLIRFILVMSVFLKNIIIKDNKVCGRKYFCLFIWSSIFEAK